MAVTTGASRGGQGRRAKTTRVWDYKSVSPPSPPVSVGRAAVLSGVPSLDLRRPMSSVLRQKAHTAVWQR